MNKINTTARFSYALMSMLLQESITTGVHHNINNNTSKNTSVHQQNRTSETNNITSLLDSLLLGYDQKTRPYSNGWAVSMCFQTVLC